MPRGVLAGSATEPRPPVDARSTGGRTGDPPARRAGPRTAPCASTGTADRQAPPHSTRRRRRPPRLRPGCSTDVVQQPSPGRAAELAEKVGPSALGQEGHGQLLVGVGEVEDDDDGEHAPRASPVRHARITDTITKIVSPWTASRRVEK